MDIREQVLQTFRQTYGTEPTLLVRAPGRVNLIGEHTDYNDGFVMPMAINRAVWLALRPRDDFQVRIQSLDFAEPIEFSLEAYGKATLSPAEYVKGVAYVLQAEGYQLTGFEGILKGDVPIGAGLSSSAAFELAIARAFMALGDYDWHPAKMALLAQKTENHWIGVNSGIMDQMISASGKAHHALLIDCRSLETEALPLPEGTAVVILDTTTRRELGGNMKAEYNKRRTGCEAAASYFGVKKLRDVTLAQFEAAQGDLEAHLHFIFLANELAYGVSDFADSKLAKLLRQSIETEIMPYARHVISENERVQAAKAAMLKGDAKALGQLLNASHTSLRDDFRVSSKELNEIVRAAQGHSACYGARMTGAGFGGCAVALIKATHVVDFVASVSAQYAEATGYQAAIYVCEATNGAEVVS